MDRRPRVFSSRLGSGDRWIYGAVAAWFLLVFLGMLWPVYPTFSRVRPFLLGMPLALFYLVVLLVTSFLVLLGLFLWELRRGVLDGDLGDGGLDGDLGPPSGQGSRGSPSGRGSRGWRPGEAVSEDR